MKDLTADMLVKAYMCGVFPMAQDRHDSALYWLDPDMRGVIPLDGLHLSAKLRRKIRRQPFEVRIDRAFRDVMLACAEPGAGRPSTWINDTIITLYSQLFERGQAHSVECWRDGALVGGLYGVALGGAFFGESMFVREADASKIALAYLVARLRHGSYRLLDTQFVTDHLRRLGAIEVPREDYQKMLRQALNSPGDFYLLEPSASPEAVLHLISQTS